LHNTSDASDFVNESARDRVTLHCYA